MKTPWSFAWSSVWRRRGEATVEETSSSSSSSSSTVGGARRTRRSETMHTRAMSTGRMLVISIMNMGKRTDNALRAAYCSGGYDDERRPRRGRRREGGRRRRREQVDTGRKADGVSGIGLQQFQSRVASKIEEIVREVDPSIELVMCKLTSAPRYRRPPAFKIVLDTNWDANGPDARGIMDGTQLAVLSSAIRERIIDQEGSDATNSIGDDGSSSSSPARLNPS